MYVCCLFARWASRHQHVKRARARETREAQWEAGALGEVVLPGGRGEVVALRGEVALGEVVLCAEVVLLGAVHCYRCC
jgi:hypothetical protein